MKKIISVLLSVFLLTSMVACTTANESSETTKKETSPKKEVLRVGMEAMYPPFNWSQNDDANGAVPIEGSKEFAGGYDVEIAKLIAEGLGKELVIVKMDWDGLPLSIQSNKIDAIIAGMSPSKERRESLDFTTSYYKSDLIVVVKSGGPFEKAMKLADFEGAKITAQLNTLHYNVIDQIPGVDKLEAMTDFSAMRVALESGRIDGYISEKPEGISAHAANPIFMYNELEDGFTLIDEEEVSVAVGLKKESPLKDPIDKILEGISQDTRDSLMENAILNQPAAQN